MLILSPIFIIHFLDVLKFRRAIPVKRAPVLQCSVHLPYSPFNCASFLQFIEFSYNSSSLLPSNGDT
jgi:hypothetical protein